MAKPTLAYILRIQGEPSKGYAQTCFESCSKVGIPAVYFMGYEHMTGKMAFRQTGIKNLPTEDYMYIQNPAPAHRAMCCTAGHFHIWKTIANGKDEAAIILEHDAIMLQPVDIDIPENRIVVLGYKLPDPSRYDHEKAGPPKEFINILGHEGAHAYAMTKKTAQFLIDEIESKGIRSAVDNDYFILGQRKTEIPLVIASPTPAMGWLRESTIWGGSAYRNYEFIPSFQENYK